MKKFKYLAIVLSLIVLMVCMFGACELNYGTPDKLGIAEASVGERITIGLLVTAMGLVIVFLVLFLLIFFVHGLKWLFVGIDKLNGLLKSKKKVVPIEDKVPQIATSNEDEEVVAAITAALVAYYSNTNYKSNVKFKVRSIKEIK
jgi:sodium pump decarboxylase gamma subunit